MYYVYVLISLKDMALYTGFTGNLKQRFKQHINGEVKTTKHRQPLKLIYYEAYLSKKDATKREYFLKGGRGRELLKKLLAHSVREAG